MILYKYTIYKEIIPNSFMNKSVNTYKFLIHEKNAIIQLYG